MEKSDVNDGTTFPLNNGGTVSNRRAGQTSVVTNCGQPTILMGNSEGATSPDISSVALGTIRGEVKGAKGYNGGGLGKGRGRGRGKAA